MLELSAERVSVPRYLYSNIYLICFMNTCETTVYEMPTLYFHSTFISNLENGDVRLVDGNHISEGRVEIFYNGQWGTVCDDNWDILDATVVCRQLNYFTATRAWPGAHFGWGTGPIHMDDLNCTGNEIGLNQCKFRGWGSHDCWHSQDAGVECNSSKLLFPDRCNMHIIS